MLSPQWPVISGYAPKQRGENRIFGQVPGFADEELNRHDRPEGNIRQEPKQKRHKKTRGVLSRHQIGRAGEDEKHPEDNKHPVKDEPANIRVQNER